MKAFNNNLITLDNLKTLKKREIFLRHLIKYKNIHQRVYTPFSLANYMVPKDLPESICVMFNLEFLEILKFVRKYDMSKVTFFGESEEEVLFAKKIYEVENSFIINGETWDKIIRKEINIQEFFPTKIREVPNITFSNLPFGKNKDLKIIKALAEANYLKKLICIHSSISLIETKTRFGFGGSKLFKDFRNLIRDKIEKIEFFNPNFIFKVNIPNDYVISQIDFTKKRQGQLLVKLLKDKEFTKDFKDIDEISIHEKSFLDLKDLIKKLKVHISQNGSFESKRITVKEANENFHDKFLVQFTIMRTEKRTDTKSNFFCFSQLKINKENKNGLKEGGELVYVFNTESEKENFLKTSKTDFMRLCLSILKTNSHLDSGELNFVPWLDFSKSWTDEELFSMFGLEKGHPLRKYTKELISDYWGIGKNY